MAWEAERVALTERAQAAEAASDEGRRRKSGMSPAEFAISSDEQILTLVNETAIAVEKLHMETVMFDKFYEKLGGGETVTGSTGRERRSRGAR